MIFADKLILLRKKSGLTQEELAEKMDVTRQSVSKWESMQSLPDLDKIIKLADMFNVSVDYLVKDEIENPEIITGLKGYHKPNAIVDDGKKRNENYANETGAYNREKVQKELKPLSIDDAHEYLDAMRFMAKRVSVAVLLFIISPSFMIFLSGLEEYPQYAEYANLGIGAGLIVVLLLVVVGLMILFSNYGKAERFSYIKEESFNLKDDTVDMVISHKGAYQPSKVRGVSIGVALLVMSPASIFLATMLNADDGFFMLGMVCVTLIFVGIGVFFLIRSLMVDDAFKRLLKEGEFEKGYTQRNKVYAIFSTSYWMIVVAGFLLYSFRAYAWDRSWIIFAVAGVLYVPFNLIVSAIIKRYDIMK